MQKQRWGLCERRREKLAVLLDLGAGQNVIFRRQSRSYRAIEWKASLNSLQQSKSGNFLGNFIYRDPETGLQALNQAEFAFSCIVPVGLPEIDMIRRRNSANKMNKFSAASVPLLTPAWPRSILSHTADNPKRSIISLAVCASRKTQRITNGNKRTSDFFLKTF